MNLDEIRARTANDPHARPTLKAATRLWLCSLSTEFHFALTLTLKQTIVETTDRGTYKRKITTADCEKIAKRFIQKLNRQVFGKRAADKYGHKLKYLAVVEGERSNKRLHLHMAIGNLPSHIKLNQFENLVSKAKLLVEHVDVEYKLDIADSGWFEYMTKEVGTKDTDNVLWSLA
jgi:hypothetical protein